MKIKMSHKVLMLFGPLELEVNKQACHACIHVYGNKQVCTCIFILKTAFHLNYVNFEIGSRLALKQTTPYLFK